MKQEPIRSIREAVDLGRLVALHSVWQVPVSDDRVLTAIIRLLGRRGYEGLTTRDVIRTAHVGRSEFYRRFTGKHDCFLVAYDALLNELERGAVEFEAPAADSTAVGSWLLAIARVLTRDRRMAKILVLESGHADVRSLPDFIAAGIAERLSAEPPPAMLSMATGSIVEILRSNLLAGGSRRDAQKLADDIAAAIDTSLPSAILGRPSARSQPRGQLLDFDAAAARRRP